MQEGMRACGLGGASSEALPASFQADPQAADAPERSGGASIGTSPAALTAGNGVTGGHKLKQPPSKLAHVKKGTGSVVADTTGATATTPVASAGPQVGKAKPKKSLRKLIGKGLR